MRHVLIAPAQRGMKRDPHADGLERLGQLGGDVALQIVVDLGGDVLGGHPLERGLDRIDDDIERVAGQHHAVLHLGHPRDGLDRAADPLGDRDELGRIVGEDLDLDRLRNGGQVADQILHQLRQVGIDARHIGLNLEQHLGHDLVDGTPRIGLEPNEEVAVVGLVEVGAAETEPGAPREGLHLRRRLQDLLDLLDLAVGLGQRGSGQGLVVDDEAAFVRLGHEAGRNVLVGEIADHHDGAEDDQQQPAVAEHAVQQPAVGVDVPAALVGRRIVPGLEIDDRAGEHRHHEGDHEHGDEQRRRHGDRQRLGERPGYAGEKRQRHEHDHGRQARPDQRRQELLPGRQHGVASRAGCRHRAAPARRRGARCAPP